MTVRIGGLRRRLTALPRSGNATTTGESGDLWAAILRETAGSEATGDGIDTRARWIIRLRRNPIVVPGLRLADGSRIWEVATTEDPDGTGRFLICQCVEVTT